MRVYHVLPSWTPMAAITLFQRVFAQRGVGSSVLAHEAVHIEQQKRDGWRFYIRYIFSGDWRAKYEAEAYAVNASGEIGIEYYAKILSGSLYLWPCSFERAKELIAHFLAIR